MTNSEQAIREFAEKWCLRVIECMKDDDYIMHDPEGILSDLTALIDEHYYDKQFVVWMLTYCPFVIGENGAGKIIALRPKNGMQLTLDELYQYYKENVR